ncbi:DUF1643 domain-containing protein [Nonomuraea sp. NBC_01738]|uniref:DUF1643 domain-containing protein n=1 Tax=Nonomuraea sp. NBC_01738 TaxID=2976003 RepID=UPI003FA3C71B
MDTTRTLCAVLLNPPIKSEPDTITHRNVRVLSTVLGCHRVTMVNLIKIPTKDLPSINNIRLSVADLDASRRDISMALSQACELVIGWGLGGLNAATKLRLREQTSWLYEELRHTSLERVWTIHGAPRHPSRWHQYVGSSKRRFEGSTFAERLEKAAEALPINSDATARAFLASF